MKNLEQRICRCWLSPALAALLALPLIGEAGIVFVQLPPSPSLGLVQNTNGDWVDPFAPYDAQGLRLWGTVDNPTNYNLVINGQTAFTFSSGTEFGIIPAVSNAVVGQVVDDFGSTYAIPLTNNQEIGADAGGYDWSSGDVLLTASRASGGGGNPILTAGYFSGLASAYIGLEFYIDCDVHYGWVRVGAPVSINGGWIYDYAYETQAGVPIAAGAMPAVALQAPPEIVRPGYLRLCWQTEIGKSYQIQSKDDLNAVLWTNLDFIVVASTTNAITDVPISGGAKFYRIVEAD